MHYRRAFIPGGSFFFTLVTERRSPIFAEDENVDTLREAFRSVKKQRPFVIDAIVIMPDHLHCIWTLPPTDSDFPTRWRLIKTWFSKHCSDELKCQPNPARARKQEQAVWQRRYWEHALRDEDDMNRHIDYIHYNPVKHGLVRTAKEWPHSTFHRYVDAGIYPADWGTNAMDFEGIGHE